MPNLHYKGKTYNCRADETILDALTRQGVDMMFSCKNGICHVCLHRCVSGEVPEKAGSSIRPGLRARGYFLPCKCIPDGDMEIEPPVDADLYSPAVIHKKEMLTDDICRLLVEPSTSVFYHAGQFMNLKGMAGGVVRSYSLASVPAQDYFLEFHIKRKKQGVMSNWILDTLQEDQEIELQGPQGSCYYVPGNEDGNLLLVGTGTGLAPLFGIVRDALHHGHRGEIFLYHGTHDKCGMYLHKELMKLSGEHENFHYNACVSGDEVPSGALAGRAHQVAFSCHTDLAGWRVYLAGLAEMVHAAEIRATEAGASKSDIYSDPFLYKDLRQKTRASGRNVDEKAGKEDRVPDTPRKVEFREYGSTRPAPDPEMWAALGNGKLLNQILLDFYTAVYEDPRLAPFFENTTKQRSIEKQYLFLRQIFTGEKVYFGDRPRNAHHWMVISNKLFDYREDLLMKVLRQYGIPDHLVARWRAMEETFRKDIVKDKPINKIVDGMELPVDGFGELVLDIGSLCDSCGGEISPGDRVLYHLRTGSTYCQQCHDQTPRTAEAK